MTIHPDAGVLAAYTDGGPLDEATLWAVEVHLETCAPCRARLAAGAGDPTRGLLDRVAADLDRAIAAGPLPARRARRWTAPRRHWAAAAFLPFVVTTVAVLLCATALDRLWSGLPSLVLLLAPLAPLPGVAAAWSRRLDPAGELVCSTPAAGLTMLLRRTLAVLAVLVPVLALLGAGSGTSLALLLLPSLAFTAGTLALGTLTGVPRAAAALGALWALAVVAPALVAGDLPPLLSPGTALPWALTAVALAGVVLARADDFRRLASRS
ncbi:zf-HC2 domain-containing protein [Blastococcus sp. SYSU D00695]